MSEILHDVHNSEIPIIHVERKSDSLCSLDKLSHPNHRFGTSLENSLSCVVTLAYLCARDTYRIEREDYLNGSSASYSFGGVSDSHKKQVFGSLLKGYVDFAFHPRRKNDKAFILELKKDDTPENAIKQIKNKEYAQKFIKENENRNMVIAAICYDSKDKEHHCLVEKI